MVAWLPVWWPQRAGQAQTLGPALLGLRGQGSHGLPEPRVHTQGLRAHRPISRTKPGDGRAGAGQGRAARMLTNRSCSQCRARGGQSPGLPARPWSAVQLLEA